MNTISEIEHAKALHKSIKKRYDDSIELLKRDRQIVASMFEHITGFDYTEAYKDYATKIGVALDELTIQQKQQAVIDAILEVSDTGRAVAKVVQNVKDMTWENLV